jgi:hypothetical protein
MCTIVSPQDQLVLKCFPNLANDLSVLDTKVVADTNGANLCKDHRAICDLLSHFLPVQHKYEQI